MNELNDDVTRSIISLVDIRSRIGSIFSDSVILDNQLNFVSISQNILDATGYDRNELSGHSISRFANTYDLRNLLQEKLRAGFFEEAHLEIVSKESVKIMYSISGFYSGLITDINGLIILKFKNLDEITLTYEKHNAKIAELDNFVYLSAHALRGPLATIKGLINLSKSSMDIDEIRFFIQQMECFAEKLDDKLHRLIFFAESDKGYESPDQDINFQSICQVLADEVKAVSIKKTINFDCAPIDSTFRFENGEVTLSLLRNLISFFCQQPMRHDNMLMLEARNHQHTIEINLRARGFALNDSITSKLKATNFGYSEILHYPELINCYAAKKAVFRLKGDLQFILSTTGDVTVSITIPSGNRCN